MIHVYVSAKLTIEEQIKYVAKAMGHFMLCDNIKKDCETCPETYHWKPEDDVCVTVVDAKLLNGGIDLLEIMNVVHSYTVHNYDDVAALVIFGGHK